MQLFFGFMALALLGVKYKGDKRDQYLHHGGWLLKLGLWLAFSALPFLFPNSLVNAYGEQLAHPTETLQASTVASLVCSCVRHRLRDCGDALPSVCCG